MIKNEQERQRIGQDIAQLRTQRGMTQGDVAERTDLLRQHISRIEQGKYSVGFDTLQAIADALDADIRIVPRQ
jgi:transcriptional regulator with XRE-family HTH domain